MSIASDAAAWFTDGANWRGQSGIPARIGEHLRYSLSALAGAAVASVPVAAWLGHRRRFGTLAVVIANIGQTLPSFAVLVLLVQLVAFRELPFAGPLALFLAMVLLAIPPLFVNAYTGVAGVDDALRDSARAAGMTSLQRLARVELPLAAPVMIAGARIAVVQVIATATIGAYLGVGGLGRYIIDGYALRDYTQVLAGAVLVASVAIVVDRALVAAQLLVVRPRLRRSARATSRRIA